MARFFGCKPAAPTRQAVEKFENEVMIRQDNQMLVGTVYLDMEETRWAVAIAYNQSRTPGLHGHEHPLEVKYSYAPAQGTTMEMFRSSPGGTMALDTRPFDDQDSFVRYALDVERKIVTRAA